LEKLTYTHGRKGQCLTGLDNMTRKGLPVEGQQERVELYAKRHSNKQNIYTGEPLTGQDLEDVNRDIDRSRIGHYLVSFQKDKHKV